MIRQLPNLVSLLRICLAPVIFRAIANHEYGLALVWLFFAAFTDILDGFLARQLGVVSRSGAYLDPIADKILLSGTYLLLGFNHSVPMWLTALVFGRDGLMLVFIVVVMLLRQARDFPPTIWGKMSTMIQIFTAFIILLSGAMSLGPYESIIKTALIYLATAGTLWSAIDYLRIGVKILRGSASPNA